MINSQKSSRTNAQKHDKKTQKSPQKKIVAIACSIVFFIICCIVIFFFKTPKPQTIPDNYIAIFHGGVGELTHETYVYKINDPDYNYVYINTESHTVRWGSSEWITTVTGQGKVAQANEIFSAAWSNDAYQYVSTPGNNKTYTIKEFKRANILR